MSADIRDAEAGDLEDLVRVHASAFPDSYMTMLGKGFLRGYYTAALGSEGIRVLVAHRGRDVLGAAVTYAPECSVSTVGIWRAMGIAEKGRCVAAMFGSVRAARGTVDNLLGLVREHPPRATNAAYLASMAVVSQAHGQGVGRALLNAACIEAAQAGQPWELDVIDDPEDPAYRMYRRAGFGAYVRYGRLDGQQRVRMSLLEPSRASLSGPGSESEVPAQRMFLLSNHFSPDSRDGTLVNDLVAELSRRGHEVLVYAQDWRGRPGTPAHFAVDGAHVAWVSPPERGGIVQMARRWLTTPFLGWRRHGKLLESFAPEWIVSFQPALTFSQQIRRLVGKGTPAMFVQWDFFPFHDAQMGTIPKRLEKVVGAVESRLINRFDVVAHMTEECTRYFDTKFRAPHPRRMVVPIWGPERLAPCSAEERAEVRASLGLEPADVAIVFGGQLSAGRGFDDIVRLAARCVTELPAAKFLVLGDGKLRTELEHAPSTPANLRFLDRRPRDQYLRLLQASEVGLVSTIGGVDVPTFPSKTLDYLRCGLPILASVEASGGYRTAIATTAEAGLVSTAGDDEAFFANVSRLVNEPELRNRLAANGGAYFDTVHRVDAIAASIEQRLRQIGSTAPRAGELSARAHAGRN